MTSDCQNKNFKVPDNYFENLANVIGTNILISDFKEKNNSTNFSVPANYFENLAYKLNTIPTTITTNLTNKNDNIFKLNFTKYAAAASILLVCCLAIYINLQNNNLQNRLQRVPVADIETYLQNNINSTDMPLIIGNINEIKLEVDKSISKKELNEYLNLTI